MDFAQGIANCIAEHGSKAFVLGTRKADPNAGGQQFFEPSSDWMPPFMRVNPNPNPNPNPSPKPSPNPSPNRNGSKDVTFAEFASYFAQHGLNRGARCCSPPAPRPQITRT